jgi:Ca2+-dependent lipid-binding protein
MRNLRDTDGAMNHPDPYVMFHLEQDNLVLDKNYGKQQSSTKKCTCNPDYNETFTFENVPSLDNLVLGIKIYDEDFGRDDHMGQKKIKLERSLTPGEEKSFNEELDRDHKGLLRKDATIQLKITYDE